MAPSEQYDRQVEELSRQYATAAAIISASIASVAAGATPAALSAARQAAQSVLGVLLGASVGWINVYVPRVYRSGVEEAAKRIGDVQRVTGPVPQGKLRREANEAMQRLEHREAMNTLAEALRDDLQGAVEGMGRDANRALGEIRRRNVQQALARGGPLTRLEDFAGEMRQRGIRFTDKSGRHWTPENYATMSLRTHVAAILNYGHINRALEMGSLYVRVSDGGPGDVDLPCKVANGQVWHVSVAIRNPLRHPNCRRSFSSLPRGYDGRVDRDADFTEAA